MDDEIKEAIDALRNVVDQNFKTVFTKLSEIERSAFTSEQKIKELFEQTTINCTKLDEMNGKLDTITEIVTANGQGIEVISGRVDKLEGN